MRERNHSDAQERSVLRFQVVTLKMGGSVRSQSARQVA